MAGPGPRFRGSRRVALSNPLIDIGAFDDLSEGGVAIASAGGRELAVVRWRGSVTVVRNVCPHQTQSFRAGFVRQTVTSPPGRPGERLADPSGPALVCPIHSWSFTLETGQCRVDPKLRVRRYPAVIRDGRILVDLQPAGRAAD